MTEQVCLVSMPFVSLKRPSLALGLLKQCLAREQVSVRVHYAALDFAVQVGLERYQQLAGHPAGHILGEWVFAGALFPDFAPDHERFFSRLPCPPLDEATRRLAWQLREAAADFIEATARRLVGHPVVACTSTFQQHCASLALLRRVRELDPGAITMIGGANCEGPMGQAVARLFPWVDLVVSGEADELFGPLCRQLLSQGIPEKLPYGVLSQRVAPSPLPPRASVRNLDQVPTPDYADYFAALEKSGLGAHVIPALALESSRGCWWGQKHHCTFCGLNGNGMGYRSKSPDRVFDEIQTLAQRHQTREFLMVDNILDLSFCKSLLPRLSQAPEKLEIFYETKANLKREQLALMAEAGIGYIQPGIESLSDELLKLMDKGTTALQNIQLLKWARELGIHVTWLTLFGFPGERFEWYQEVAELVPSLTHLQPPNGLIQVGFHRFSPYFERAAEFGLELAVEEGFRAVYPFGDEDLFELCYYFVDRRERPPHYQQVLELLGPALHAWRVRFWEGNRPVVTLDDDGQAIHVLDTRPASVQRRSRHTGMARQLLLACDGIRGEASLLREFGEAARASLEELVALRLILRHRGQLLTLAVPGELPALRRRLPTGQVRLPAELVG